MHDFLAKPNEPFGEKAHTSFGWNDVDIIVMVLMIPMAKMIFVTIALAQTNDDKLELPSIFIIFYLILPGLVVY